MVGIPESLGWFRRILVHTGAMQISKVSVHVEVPLLFKSRNKMIKKASDPGLTHVA